MDDQICPSCGIGHVRARPRVGYRDEYECPHCRLVFCISGSDLPAITAGERTRLVPDASGRMWLRPECRADLP